MVQMHANGSNQSGLSGNKAVHEAQRALVHYAEIHPANSEGKPHALDVRSGRRYMLNSLTMSAICGRVELDVVAELQRHAHMTIEEIAHYAALACEHAIQVAGVERTL
jgi:hypothetical protein